MIRQVIRLLLVGLTIGSGIAVFAAIDSLEPSFRKNRYRLGFARFLNRVLVLILGIRVELKGYELDDLKPVPGLKGRLIVANHLTYLDAIVLGALAPVRFIAKQEVCQWPVIGQLAALAGTIFIDRDSPRQGLRVASEITTALKQGVCVVLFPEGTSSNGEQLLEFKPMLFAGALKAAAPIQPLILKYTEINGHKLSLRNRDDCYWYGNMEFASHFWKVLGLKEVAVTVEVMEMIDTSIGDSVQEIAATAHRMIAERYTSEPAEPQTTPDEQDDFLLGALVLALANAESSNLREE